MFSLVTRLVPIAKRIAAVAGVAATIYSAWDAVAQWYSDNFSKDPIAAERMSRSLTEQAVAASIVASGGISFAVSLYRAALISPTVYLRCLLIVVAQRSDTMPIPRSVLEEFRTVFGGTSGSDNEPGEGDDGQPIVWNSLAEQLRITGALIRHLDTRGIVDLYRTKG